MEFRLIEGLMRLVLICEEVQLRLLTFRLMLGLTKLVWFVRCCPIKNFDVGLRGSPKDLMVFGGDVLSQMMGLVVQFKKQGSQ